MQGKAESWCPGEMRSRRLATGALAAILSSSGSQASQTWTGDYSTPDTDYGDAKTADVYYNHGMDASLGLRRLGKADLRTDDAGFGLKRSLRFVTPTKGASTDWPKLANSAGHPARRRIWSSESRWAVR